MNILESKKSSLVFEERGNKNIVIGVPHHAPAGVSYLSCRPRRPADENAGYLGLYIAEKLKCSFIIACYYYLDANKNMSNPYAKLLLKWNPNVLVEIHGHKRKKTKNDIEISCGSKKLNDYSLTLAEKIGNKCQGNDELNWLTICGDFNKILFKAETVKTIQHPDWLGILIELPPELRFEKGQEASEPPQKGYVFCDYLIESLKEMSLV